MDAGELADRIVDRLADKEIKFVRACPDKTPIKLIDELTKTDAGEKVVNVIFGSLSLYR